MPKPSSPGRYPHEPEYALPARLRQASPEQKAVRSLRKEARDNGDPTPPLFGYYGPYDRARMGD